MSIPPAVMTHSANEGPDVIRLPSGLQSRKKKIIIKVKTTWLQPPLCKAEEIGSGGAAFARCVRCVSIYGRGVELVELDPVGGGKAGGFSLGW